jgi:hypothetical protein
MKNKHTTQLYILDFEVWSVGGTIKLKCSPGIKEG